MSNYYTYSSSPRKSLVTPNLSHIKCIDIHLGSASFLSLISELCDMPFGESVLPDFRISTM